ncbi:hypothetical protein HY478_01275 [Candidatus Uhrbacteria bacterium]|nr:hypothetical protein [Candidatus Uhrbacteria bacterium]
MKVVKTDDFLKSLAALPKTIERLYRTQEERFRMNYRDPRLHIKSVRGLAHVLSLRITRRYRAFFYFQNAETAVFFDIDHRKDAYR